MREQVVNLRPCVEFREDLVGTKRDEEHDVGQIVELQFWRSDESEGWLLDIYGPEPDRTRRIILHSDVDVLNLASLVEERSAGSGA